MALSTNTQSRLHVPIRNYWATNERTVHRVYPPARLRRRLAKGRV
jgi:hypothetical protein